MKKIETEELEKVNAMNVEFNSLKKAIADAELQKHVALHKISSLQSEFKELETELVEKYGDNVTINLETGEIKENVEDK